MTIDLDRIERIATEALVLKPPWFVDKMTTEECVELGNDSPNAYEGYWILNEGNNEVISDPHLAHEAAEFITTCSPDVVLELVRRVRATEANAALTFLRETLVRIEGQLESARLDIDIAKSTDAARARILAALDDIARIPATLRALSPAEE
jgi:hypothetical protein